MKRLKYYLLQMKNDTTTYKEIYNGEVIVYPYNSMQYKDYDNNYYHNDIMLKIDITNKCALAKPTLIWHIPIKKLGFETVSSAAADHCLRVFEPYIDELNVALCNRSRPDEENGKYYLYHPSSEVITRNTAYFATCPQKDYENGNGNAIYLLNDGVSRPPQVCLCICMQVQLPKNKLRKVVQMLCYNLPDAIDKFVAQFDLQNLSNALFLAEKQSEIRAWLKNSNYCAFIANGSILPRSKGTSLPMKNAVPFQSPKDDEIIICGICGMGIKRGVTVITGGGYSGKSTLLGAISAGIYDHYLGDGRELCITDDTAMIVSAEEGRSVKSLNITPFFKWSPEGNDAHFFSTDQASGSTSQAANIIEAVDCGAKLLLIDEDMSAINFMIRDEMMRELIDKEPIIPFTERVQELFKTKGVSTIIIIGGSGEYLAIADKIYLMDDFQIKDVTTKAKKIYALHGVLSSLPKSAEWEQNRKFYSDGFTSYHEGSGSEKLEVSDMGFITIGDECIDIHCLYNIVTKHQLDTLGYMLRYLEIHNNDRIIDIDKQIDNLYKSIDKEGLDMVFTNYFITTERFLDLPRKQELKAVINRMRRISVKGGV